MLNIKMTIMAMMNTSGVRKGSAVVKTEMDQINIKAKAASAGLAGASSGLKQNSAALAANATSTKANEAAKRRLTNTNKTLHNSEIFIQKAWERGSTLVDKRYLSSINGLREGLKRFNDESEVTMVRQRGVIKALSDPSLATARRHMTNDLKMRTAMNMTDQFVNKSKNLQWTGRQMMVGITAPIAAVGALSIGAYKELGTLEVKLRKVLRDSYGANAVTGELDKIRDKATELSERFGLLRTDMMSSAETFAKAGILGDDLEANVDLSAKLNIVGDVDMPTATDLVRLLAKNGYDPDMLADQLEKLNVIDDRTNITLQGMSAALVEVQPLMEEFGVTAAETAAMVAGITEAGYSEMEAAIAIRNLFTKMPSAMANLQSGDPDLGTRLKALQHTLEVINQQAGINIEVIDDNGNIKQGVDLVSGIAKGVNDLENSGNPQLAAQMLSGFRNLFGAEQAGEGRQFFDALAIAIEGGSNDLYKAMEVARGNMGNATDAWNAQIAEYENSDVVQYQKAVEELRNTAQDLGRTLIPVATDILKTISKIVDKFMEAPEGTKKVIMSLLGMVALVGPITYAFGQMGVLFGTIGKAGLKFLRQMVPGLRGLKMSTIGVTSSLETVDESWEKLIRSYRKGDIDQQGLVRGAKELTTQLENIKGGAVNAAHGLDDLAAANRNCAAGAKTCIAENAIPQNVRNRGATGAAATAAGAAGAGILSVDERAARAVDEAMPIDPEVFLAQKMIEDNERLANEALVEIGRAQSEKNKIQSFGSIVSESEQKRNAHLVRAKELAEDFRARTGYDLPAESLAEAGDFLEGADQNQLGNLMQELESGEALRVQAAKRDLEHMLGEFRGRRRLNNEELERIYRKIAEKDPAAAEKFKEHGRLRNVDDLISANPKEVVSADQFFREQLALFEAPEGANVEEARMRMLDDLLKKVQVPQRHSYVEEIRDKATGEVKERRAVNVGTAGAVDDMFTLNNIAREYGFIQGSTTAIPPILDVDRAKELRNLFEIGPDAPIQAERERKFEEVRNVLMKRVRGEELSAEENNLLNRNKSVLKGLEASAKNAVNKEKDPIVRRTGAWKELTRAFDDTYASARQQADSIDSIFQNMVSGNLDDLLEMEGGADIADALGSVDAGIVQDKQKQLADIMDRLDAANIEVAKFAKSGVAPSARMMDDLLAVHEELDDFKFNLMNSNDDIGEAVQMLAGDLEKVSYARYAGDNSRFGRELNVDRSGKAVLAKNASIRRSRASAMENALEDAIALLDDTTGAKGVESLTFSDRATNLRKQLARKYEDFYGVVSKGETLDKNAVGQSSVAWQNALGLPTIEERSLEQARPAMVQVPKKIEVDDVSPLDLYKQSDSLLGKTDEQLAEMIEANLNGLEQAELRHMSPSQRGARIQEMLDEKLPKYKARQERQRRDMREARLKSIGAAKATLHNVRVDELQAQADEARDEFHRLKDVDFGAEKVQREKAFYASVLDAAGRGDVDSIESMASEGMPRHLQEVLGKSLWGAPEDRDMPGFVEEAFLASLPDDERTGARAKAAMAFNELQRVVARRAGASHQTMTALTQQGFKLRAEAAIDAAKDADLTPDMKMPGLTSTESGIKSWYADIEAREGAAFYRLKEDIAGAREEIHQNDLNLTELMKEKYYLSEAVDGKMAKISGLPEELDEINRRLDSDYSKFKNEVGKFSFKEGDEGSEGLGELLRRRSQITSDLKRYMPTQHETGRLAELENIERDTIEQNKIIKQRIASNETLMDILAEQQMLRDDELGARKELRDINKRNKVLEQEADNVRSQIVADDDLIRRYEMHGEKERLKGEVAEHKADLAAAEEAGRARLAPYRTRLEELEQELIAYTYEAEELEYEGKKFEAGQYRTRAKAVENKITDVAEELRTAEAEVAQGIDEINDVLATKQTRVRSLASQVGAGEGGDRFRAIESEFDRIEKEQGELAARRGELISRSRPAVATRNLDQLMLLEAATGDMDEIDSLRSAAVKNEINARRAATEADEILQNATSARYELDQILAGETIGEKKIKRLQAKSGLDLSEVLAAKDKTTKERGGLTVAKYQRELLEQAASELDEFVDIQKVAKADLDRLLVNAASELDDVRGMRLGSSAGLARLSGTLDEGLAKALNDIVLLQVEDPKKAAKIFDKYGIDMLDGIEKREKETEKDFNKRKEEIRRRWGQAGIRTGRQIRANIPQAEALFGDGLAKAIRDTEGGTYGTTKQGMAAAQTEAQRLMRQRGMSVEEAYREVMKTMTTTERRVFNPQDTISDIPEHANPIDLVAGGSGEFVARDLQKLRPESDLLHAVDEGNLADAYKSTDEFKDILERQVHELKDFNTEFESEMGGLRGELADAKGRRRDTDRKIGDLMSEYDGLIAERDYAIQRARKAPSTQARKNWNKRKREAIEKIAEWNALHDDVLSDLGDELDLAEADEERVINDMERAKRRREDFKANQKAGRDQAFRAFTELDEDEQRRMISPVARDIFELDETKAIDQRFASQILELDRETDRAIVNYEALEDIHRRRADALDDLAKGLRGSATDIEASKNLLENLDRSLMYTPEGNLVLRDTGRTIRDEAKVRTSEQLRQIEGQDARKSKRNKLLYGPFRDRAKDEVGVGDADEVALAEMIQNDLIYGDGDRQYSKLDIEDFRAKKERGIEKQRIMDQILDDLTESGETDLSDDMVQKIERTADAAALERVPLSTLEAVDAGGPSTRERVGKKWRDRDRGVSPRRMGRGAKRVGGGALKAVGAVGALPVQASARGTKAAASGIKQLFTGFTSLGKAGAKSGALIEGMFLGMDVGLSGVMGKVFMFLPLVAAIAAIAFLIYKNWDKVSEGIGGALDRFKDAGSALINAVLEPIRGLFAKLASDKSAEGIGSLWQNVGKVMGFVMDILSGIMNVLAPIVRAIMEVVSTIIYSFVQLVRVIFAIFTGDWEDAWDGIKNIFGAVWNGMRALAAGAINAIIEMVFWMADQIFAVIDGIGNTAIDIVAFINPMGGAGPLEDMRGSLDGFRDDLRAAKNAATGWVDENIAGGDTFSAKGKKKDGKKAGEKIKDGVNDGVKKGGGVRIPVDYEQAAADGREAAEKLRDAFFSRMDQIVEGWKQAALDVFDDWAKAQVEAIDDKLEAIDKEVEAERQKQEDLDYLQRREELRNKKRSARIKHESDRALAIYEGRYDDAAQMDYDYEVLVNEINTEIEDHEKSRQQTLTDRVREGERERLEIEKTALQERLDLQREGLQKQLDAITEYTPLNVAEAKNQQAQILAALGARTGEYGGIGLAQSEAWKQSWSTAMQQAKTDVAHEARKSGEAILNEFAKGMGVSIDADAAAKAGGLTTTGGDGNIYSYKDVQYAMNSNAGILAGGHRQGTITDAKLGPGGSTRRHSGGRIGNTSMAPADVPATLQTGEYVIRRSAVAKLGTAFMDQINRGEQPVYHKGGFVGAAKSMMRREFGNAVEAFKAGKTKIGGGSYDELKNAYMSAMGGMGGMGIPLGGRIDVAGKSIGEIVDTIIKGIHPVFQQRLQNWNNALGGKFDISRGYRSMAQQAYLYNRWINRVPGQALAAPPGRSMHNFGLAVDLDSPNRTTPSERALGTKFGLRWPMSFEPWHVEPVEARSWRAAILSGHMPGGTDHTPTGAIGSGPFNAVQGLFGAVAGGIPGTATLGNTPLDVSKTQIKSIARTMLGQFGWGTDQWGAVENLVQGESSWNPRAANPISSARGLFQKMTSIHGALEQTIEGQVAWGYNYIKQHKNYGSPAAAYAKWLSRSPHWYHGGGMVFPSLDVGGKILEDGFAKVHRNERVLNPAETRIYEGGGGGGDKFEAHLHFEGGFFGSDRELEKLVDTIDSRVMPKIQRMKGNGSRRFSTYG